MKLLKAMATVAGFSMISRVSGMVRDIMMAGFMGAGPLSDAFFVALKLPNMFRRITAEGAFTVSFVPLYSKTIEIEGEQAAGEFAGKTFSMMALILSVFSIAMMIFMPWVIKLIAPGFEVGEERFQPAVDMTQITFPYLLLMSLTALFGGMLNVHHKFGPFAAAPIFFNICAISAILVGHYFFADPASAIPYAMAWGVTLSGFIQLWMMIHYVRKYKISYSWQGFVWDEKIKKIFKLMGPGFVGSGILQINIFIDTLFASLLPIGAISYLYYADRLQQLPLGIIGLAVGAAILPMLSRSIASGNVAQSRELFNRSLEYTYIIALPAAVALLIIPIPIVALILERGAFTQADTVTTSYVVMGYAVGLPAYIAGKVFASIFWAQGDTMTPVKISIANSLLNTVLCFAFIKFTPMGIAGIALATGLSGWLQLILYSRKLKGIEIAAYDEQFKKAFPQICFSACVMAVVLAGLGYTFQDYFHSHTLAKLLTVAALISAGGLTYISAIWYFGIVKIKDIKELLNRKRLKDETNPIGNAADE